MGGGGGPSSVQTFRNVHVLALNSYMYACMFKCAYLLRHIRL